MRKLIILCALVLWACQSYAQESTIKTMQAKGLPKEAIPAKYFFEHQFYPAEQLKKFTDIDVGSSSVTTPDNSDLGNDTEHFFFVVPQPSTPDQDFTYIDLWVVDDNGNPRRIFHQDANHFGEHMALDIHFLSDVETRDSVYTDTKTKQRITRHLRKGVPVVAMEMQLYNGTVHGIVSTLLVQCKTGETTLLENQQPVGVLSPLSNMLMMAEFYMPQQYLLTTSTEVFSASTYEPTDDFTLFSHQQFTPVLYIYTPKGELVGTQQLPTECIDMVR